MSKPYERVMTLYPNLDEIDLPVRGLVMREGINAYLDGDPEFHFNGEWRHADDLGLPPSDRDRIEEALIDAAYEDDSSQCQDRDAEDDR